MKVTVELDIDMSDTEDAEAVVESVFASRIGRAVKLLASSVEKPKTKKKETKSEETN